MDRFVCPSEFARDKLVDAGLPRDRVSVKRHFLHPDPRVSTRHDGPAIFLGRLDSVKGADLLLDAWTRLPDLPLTMVGDGPLREPLERLAQERNLPVRFLGLRSPEECRELLRDAGFLVFPSPAHETFGLAVRDAMALGKPILAPDRGAASELVDTECSLRFRSGDAEDLASNARTLAANAELRDRLGAAARRKFEEELGDEPAYRQLMEIYRHATLAC